MSYENDAAENDAATSDLYDISLDTAAAFYMNMSPAAKEDVRIIAVTEGGAVQVIGTRAVWPANTDLVIDGPAVLTYKRDIEARAAELATIKG